MKKPSSSLNRPLNAPGACALVAEKAQAAMAELLVAERFLQRLANEVGGRQFYDDLADVTEMFEKLKAMGRRLSRVAEATDDGGFGPIESCPGCGHIGQCVCEDNGIGAYAETE